VNRRPYTETVLVVDDTEFMVKVLEDIFASAGFEVLTAANGEEALALYEVGLEAKVLEAFRLGARNYVLKPFERDKVLEAARKVLDEY
jgi:CheY-like chemotaxis protein